MTFPIWLDRTLILSAALVLIGGTVALTGATPLYWLSLLFACLEAGLRQAAETVWVALRHYWRGYPRMLRRVRQEVAQRVVG